jgi:hypothetical protein
MKTRILLPAIGAACCALSLQADTVSTFVGGGADLEFREQINSSVFSQSTSDGTSQNTRTSSGGDRNEVVGLKFDLTGYTLANLTSASLNLYAFRLDNSTRFVSLYGVAQGTVSGTGNFTTETWNETASLYGDLPGLLASDSNPLTQNLNSTFLTPLGNYTIASAKPEGTIHSLSDPLITSFLQSYAGSQYLTFILAANSTSTGQFRTATRESTQTATGVLTGPAGSFAPYLSFTVVPEPSSIALFALGGLALFLRRRS